MQTPFCELSQEVHERDDFLTAIRMTCSARVESKHREMHAPEWRARKRRHLTLKHGQTREGAPEMANTSGQRYVSGSTEIRLNVRRVSAAQ